MNKLLVGLFSLCFVGATFGQDAALNYGAPIVLNDHFPLGFSLSYEGTEYGTTFGVDPAVAAPLNSNPRVKPLVASYNAKLFQGNLELYGGLASVIVGAAMSADHVSSSHSQPVTPPATQVAIGQTLLTVGLVAVVVSFFTFNSGSDDLRHGAEYFNYDRQNPPSARPVISDSSQKTMPVTPAAEAAGDQDQSITLQQDGITSFSLNYRGGTFGTVFGLDPTVGIVMIRDPKVRPLVDGYNTKRIMGWYGLGGSAFMLIFGPFLQLAGDSSLFGYNPAVSRWGTGITWAGFATTALSFAALMWAGADLKQGVEVYNANLPH